MKKNGRNTMAEKVLRFLVIAFFATMVSGWSSAARACDGPNCGQTATSATNAEAGTAVDAVRPFGDDVIGGESWVEGTSYVSAKDPLKAEVVADHTATLYGFAEDRRVYTESTETVKLGVVFGTPLQLHAGLYGGSNGWLKTTDNSTYSIFGGGKSTYQSENSLSNCPVRSLISTGNAFTDIRGEIERSANGMTISVKVKSGANVTVGH